MEVQIAVESQPAVGVVQLWTVRPLTAMKKITPLQFKEAFQQTVSNAEADLITRWHTAKDYTSLMREKILPAIGPLLGVQVYSGDYYTLDCIYFTERDTEHFGAHTTYATYLSIALEHENDIRGTAIEMNKLQLFNAPLKVLITYCQDASERGAYLQRYNKILRAGDIFGDFATLRRHLVIFGSRQDAAAKWNFYAYEPSGFQEVPVA